MYSVIFPLHILLHVVYNRSDMALDYRAWLECAKAELSALQSRKDGIRQQMESLRLMENNIDRQINGLAQTVAGLAPLVPEEPIDFSFRSVLGLVGKAIVDVGITDRIRAILRAEQSRDSRPWRSAKNSNAPDGASVITPTLWLPSIRR